MTSPQIGPKPGESKATGKARDIELGAQVTAGGFAAPFGAAKIRDSHREQYPARHTKGVKRAVKIVRAKGATPQQAARVAHVLHGAKPGFKTLVGLSTAGAVATGAHRAQLLEQAIERRRQNTTKESPVSKDAFGVERISKEGPANEAEIRDRRNRVEGALVSGGAAGGAPAAAKGARLRVAGDTRGTRAALRASAATLHGGRGAVIGGATGIAAATALHSQQLKSQHKAAQSSTVVKDVFGLEKGISDNPTFKATVYNKDTLGGPNAKGNRKIMRRKTAKGIAVGIPAGTAAGAAAGAALTRSKAGAAIGGVIGGNIGAEAGLIHGSKKAQADPNYVAKSDAFGVEKSATGTPGDKRNTKYVAAGYAGAATGALAGRTAGARSAGTSMKAIKEASGPRVVEAAISASGPKHAAARGPVRDVVAHTRSMTSAGSKALRETPGAARAIRGNKIGAAVGGAAAVGAYARHRRNGS